MKQNSNKFFKVTLIVFAVSLVVSSIFYFTVKPGEVGWYEYEEGISKAASENKPVLLFSYYFWSRTSRLASQSIYSEENIVGFIEDNFIPVVMNMEDKDDRQTANKDFSIEGAQLSYILDKHGRVVSFLENITMPFRFLSQARSAAKSPYLSLPYYNEAMKKSESTGKPVLLLVVGTLRQNGELLEQFNNPAFKKTIKEHFVPTTLFTYNEEDSATLAPLLSEDADWVNQSIVTKSDFSKMIEYSQIGVAVISSDGEFLYNKGMDKFDEEALRKVISKLEGEKPKPTEN